MMNDLEKAKQALEKSISIVPLGSAYATLARISLKKKDTTEAIRLLEEGLKVPDTKDADIDIVNLLSSIELNRGNYQHAAELSRRAYTLKDSMVKRQQEENVKAVQIEYDRKTEAEQSVIVRRWLWTGIGVVALTGGIVVAILIRRSRREKQQLAEERQRVEQLSEEGRKELHDDALAMLRDFDRHYATHAVVGIYEANSEGDDIIAGGERIPMLRPVAGTSGSGRVATSRTSAFTTTVWIVLLPKLLPKTTTNCRQTFTYYPYWSI